MNQVVSDVLIVAAVCAATMAASDATFTMEAYMSGRIQLTEPYVTREELAYIGDVSTNAPPKLVDRAVELVHSTTSGKLRWPYPHAYALNRMRGPHGFRLSKHEQISAMVECRQRCCKECYRRVRVDLDFRVMMCLQARWRDRHGSNPGWYMTRQLTTAYVLSGVMDRYLALARAQDTVLGWHHITVRWAQRLSPPRYDLAFEYMDSIPYPTSQEDLHKLIGRGLVAHNGTDKRGNA